MQPPNTCINHPTKTAWYIAANKFYCSDCRDLAIAACAKQSLKRSTPDNNNYDPRYRRTAAFR